MNDDQIRSELERRATSTSSRPDSVRRDLLPAVWREVDARPQRVMTSNWSPRLGVAAVVAALLIMVIAVPRLVPQNPAATPTLGTPPGVVSADEFATRLGAGQLDGQTVLANAAIVAYDGPVIFGSFCGPNGPACLLGQLEGVTPRVLVYSPDIKVPLSDELSVSASPGWPWWQRVRPPISGTLIFKAQHSRSALYIGRARPNGANLTWSVDQAKSVDVNTLGRDEVLLVDGYLGGYTNTRCLALPIATFDGLASRSCSYEWIARVSDPGGSPVLQVQPGAYQEFALNPTKIGERLARHGTYAAGPRLEAWCPEVTPPCWQWNVLARIAPPDMPLPTNSPAATASPTPSPTPLAQGTRQVECAAPEQLVAEAVSIIDHSGRVGGCSIAHTDVVPAGNVQISTTGLPGQLAVDWKVNSACPGEFAMEFWGPIGLPAGDAIYALRIARTGLSGATCISETVVRRVQVYFTNSVKPDQIQAFVADEFRSVNSNSSSVSATTADGTFTLYLGTPLSGFQANEPIVIRAQLTYDGPADSAIISGGFPELWLASLTGGPIFSPYVTALPCPHSQEELTNPGSLGSQFPPPQPPDHSDPNRAFYDEFVSDGALRLPAGTYLFGATSEFKTGKSCSGDGVRLNTAIVVNVH